MPAVRLEGLHVTGAILTWWRRRRRRRRRVFGHVDDLFRVWRLVDAKGPANAIYDTTRIWGRCRTHAAAEGIDFSIDYGEGSDP